MVPVPGDASLEASAERNQPREDSDPICTALQRLGEVFLTGERYERRRGARRSGCLGVVMTDFVKTNPDAPPGFFACEATGLRWLSTPSGGVPCARVVGWDGDSLTVQRLHAGPPSAQAAFQFGCRLAVTHDAGAAGFGAGPTTGWGRDSSVPFATHRR